MDCTDIMVSHPNHYQGGKFQVIDVIKEYTNCLQGILAVDYANAIKYVLRYHKKNGIQDLNKALWYLDHMYNEAKAEFEVSDGHFTTHYVTTAAMLPGEVVMEFVKNSEHTIIRQAHETSIRTLLSIDSVEGIIAARSAIGTLIELEKGE